MWQMQQPHRQPIYSFCTLARFYILNGQKGLLGSARVSERGYCQLGLAWFVSEALSVSISTSYKCQRDYKTVFWILVILVTRKFLCIILPHPRMGAQITGRETGMRLKPQ